MIGFPIWRFNAEDDIYSSPIFEKLFTLEESGKGGEWNLGKESANPNREVELGAGTPIKFTKPEPFSFALWYYRKRV